MNNNIIKSLRRTLLCTVAAAAVTIGFTACADEAFTTQNTTAPANGYQVIIPSNMGGGDTRAIAYNSETGGYDETFELTDRIYVYNNKLEGWSDGPLKPDSEGKSTNLVGTLNFYSEDIAVGDELLLCYKGTSFYYSRDFSSDTSLSDYSLATVKITDIKDGVIKTSAATFKNLQSVYKINFTGIASDNVKIKKVFIESEQRKLVNYYRPTNKEWPNDFGPVTYTFEEEGRDLSDFIFLLRFADNPDNQKDSGNPNTSSDVISFRSLGSDGHFYVGTKSVTADLENSKYYQADVAMADAGMAMTLTNNTTGEVVVLDSYTQIHSNQAPYTLEHNGYDLDLEWDGGDNTLTFKNISLSTPYEGFRLFPDKSDPDNTKNHYLVLEGENTLYCFDNDQGFNVLDGSSLYVSAKSAEGMLNITQGVIRLNNATMTLESGEITVNGYIEMYDNSTIKVEGGVLTANTLYGGNSSCIISKGGKLRIAKNGYIEEGLIKAAEGYVLVVSDDGEYWAYTAIEDDHTGLAKSIVVMPGAVTLTYGLSDWGGEELRAYVYPETTKDQSVTWKTSNPDVVEVYGEGKIRATGVGVATVTATTKDGTNLSAECIVTVKPVGGIMYENYEVSVTPESQPFINPLTIEGNITSITYTSSDTSVATVNASTGEVTITSGATAGQTVTITANATVEEDGVYFYPEYRRTSSYTVKLVSSIGQGERNNYTPGSW